jgi:hypothetical protein
MTSDDYELRRQQNIARNEEFLRSLGLLELKKDISVQIATVAPQVRLKKAKRVFSEREEGDNQGARRSRRLRGTNGALNLKDEKGGFAFPCQSVI